MITAEQAAQQKDTLPRGWGRFGKAIDHLVEASLPDEELVATCVTLNPSFRHGTISTAGTLFELTQSTNTVLAVTTERLIVVATGVTGAPRNHYAIPFDGLTIVDAGKRDITLRWDEGEARFKGAAKPQLPGLVDALRARLNPRG